MNVSYPYFMLCLFAASFHTSEDETFFWGLCALLAWALWPQRSRRYRRGDLGGRPGGGHCAGLQRAAGRRAASTGCLRITTPQWFSRVGRRRRRPDAEQDLAGPDWPAERLQQDRHSPRAQGRQPGAGAAARSQLPHLERRRIWYSDIARDKFENVYEETNHTTWVLLPGKTNSAAVNLACYLPGGIALLPLPTGSGRLENLSAFLCRRAAWAPSLAEGPGLVVFDALYGPGPTIDSPANTNEDLAVPPKETTALDQVIAELQLKRQSRKQALRTLSGFFQDTDKFRYSTWQGSAELKSTNETPLSRFLLRTRSGHCEYFATATVLLLRQLGIPARYAVGYAVHEGLRQANTSSASAMPTPGAWCGTRPAETWQDFDTTPASWVQAEADRAVADAIPVGLLVADGL